MNGNTTVKTGLVQLNTRIREYEVNIARAARMLELCANNNCALACLPEAFASAVDLGAIEQVAEEIPGPTSRFLCGKAQELGLFIIAGILETHGGRRYSSALLIDNAGLIIGHYRRIHVFSLEKSFLAEGPNANQVIHSPVGRIGLLLGYDINFPESCRSLFMDKAEMIVCPAQIPATYAAATVLLAQARAAENNCYFLLAGGCGENGLAQFSYMGRSLIARNPVGLDPFGLDYVEVPSIIAHAGKEETILFATLDMKQIRREQGRSPLYKDLRFSTIPKGMQNG